MGRSMRAPALWAAALVTCTLLAGCGRDAPPAHATGPDSAPLDMAPAAESEPNAKSAAPLPPWATGRDAAAFHRNVAALDRIRATLRFAVPSPLPRIEAFSSTSFAKPLTQALSRAAALAAGPAESSARRPLAEAFADDPPFHEHISFDGDTSWFVYDDSARGRIHWIHAFQDADGVTYSLVRDSLVYRWPFAPGAPVLTASHSRRLRFDGILFEEGLSDGDGDGDLNGAGSALGSASGSGTGGALRRFHTYAVTVGDTAWKSVSLLEHGEADSTGEGVPLSFADSIFVKGDAVAGTRSYDGDGDGFVLRGSTGGRMVVQTESFHRNADGLRIHARNAYGPGADGDYLASEDNPLYPFAAAVLDGSGDTLSLYAYGDADGDGYYADPASGAANLAWETGRHLRQEGSRSYRDSLVKSLGALGDAGDDRVAFYRADVVQADGTEITAGAPGRDGNAAYSGRIPGGARVSGWYHAESGRFRDTLARVEAADLGGKGGRIKPLGRPSAEICEGVYDPATGAADFTMRAPSGSGEPDPIRMVLEAASREKGGARLFLAAEGDTADYRLGDSAVTWSATHGDTLVTFTSVARSDGGYRVSQRVARVAAPDKGPGRADGKDLLLATGEYAFRADGSGRGSYRGYPRGALQAPVELLFDADGAVRAGIKPGRPEIPGPMRSANPSRRP